MTAESESPGPFPVSCGRCGEMERTLDGLIRAAEEVSRQGATPGRHFVRLTMAIVRARAARTGKDG